MYNFDMKTRYIFVTGGVASSLGKGIVAASLGALMKARGLAVKMQKLDPYLNVDPGTLNPMEHGEVYVTDDGAETDLDLGHYERFLGEPMSAAASVTSGQVYQAVISKERAGGYGGKTVQVVPHVTDEIKRRVLASGQGADVVIVEIGGTVGDIEGLPFLEAVRQLRYELGERSSAVVHLALVPYVAAAGELKTKPAQHSVRKLLELGVSADVLVLRADRQLPAETRAKLAAMCNVRPDCVGLSADVSSVYEVPEQLRSEGVDAAVLRCLGMDAQPEADMSGWDRMLAGMRSPKSSCTVALVGKYAGLTDAYKSIVEALSHAGAKASVRVSVEMVDCEDQHIEKRLLAADGIIVAPGFGERGFVGKLAACRFARENRVPFLGICFGMQAACVEFARNVCSMPQASTEELTGLSDSVVSLLPGVDSSQSGGTMRLGARDVLLEPGLVKESYGGAPSVRERHRHRYALSATAAQAMERAGLLCTASSVHDGNRIPEAVELRGHPFYVGVQFHPEYRSYALEPHPLFVSLVYACVRRPADASERVFVFVS